MSQFVEHRTTDIVFSYQIILRDMLFFQRFPKWVKSNHRSLLVINKFNGKILNWILSYLRPQVYNCIEVINMTKNFFIELVLAMSLSFCIGTMIGNKINERLVVKANYREFEFRGGFSHCGGGYEVSLSHVLVNEKNYDVEEMFQKVYNQFILMNGEPDELTINLYNSKAEMDAGEVAASKYYVKSDEDAEYE